MTNRPSGMNQSWKGQALLIGGIAGAGVGLLAAFMYTRAAEEDASRLGTAQRVSTGDVIGLGLALLAIVRQVTEMGKAPAPKNRR